VTTLGEVAATIENLPVVFGALSAPVGGASLAMRPKPSEGAE
jgi:hypothetical protein|tara:strand:- start:2451 stop:2576 length:126 start_codon:yes stop_codon:yes gene_type:complete